MTNFIEIPFGDQKWKTTPFHCVVGPIINVDEPDSEKRMENWWSIKNAWHDAFAQMNIKTWAGAHITSFETYLQPYQWKQYVEQFRQPHECRPSGCFVLNYTNNPLVVNEMKFEECTLASVEDGKVILTNFTDLYDAEAIKKVYLPGEFWVSYCEGGVERNLRFGERNPKSRMG